VVFDHDHSVFVGDPSPELDDAWAGLLKSSFSYHYHVAWNLKVWQTPMFALPRRKWITFLIERTTAFHCPTAATMQPSMLTTTFTVSYVLRGESLTISLANMAIETPPSLHVRRPLLSQHHSQREGRKQISQP